MLKPYRHSVFLFLVITTMLLQETAFSFCSNRIQQNFSEVVQDTLPSRKDYALFFAVDDYREAGLQNLKGPISDAEKIATLLENHYGFETSLFRNLNRQEIEDKLEEWQEKEFREDDQLLVFFSGHGKYEEKYNKGYFIPAGKPGAFNSSFNELLDLATLVTKIPCEHILLAIDACYSGTIDREIRRRDTADPRETIKNINDKIKFIQNQWQFKSRLFLTSGGKVRTPDDSEFAKALMEALRSTLTSGDGILAYQDILGRLIRVSPLPHYGELDGHENGGFLFISEKWNDDTNIEKDLEREKIRRKIEKGITYFDNGNYIKAFEILNQYRDYPYLSSEAQNMLGLMHVLGKGTTRDESAALNYFKSSAESGNSAGQYNLGLLYKRGTGTKVDFVKAVYWFQKSATGGNPDGQVCLGHCYFNGEGVRQDYVEAAKWYRRASDSGNSEGHTSLGQMYYEEKGVPKDDWKVFELFEKAALNGDAVGQVKLGLLYLRGIGVNEDVSKAFHYFDLSAKQGNKIALYNLALMYEKGIYTRKNITKAIHIYQKAAEMGLTDAEEAIRRLRNKF